MVLVMPIENSSGDTYNNIVPKNRRFSMVYHGALPWKGEQS
jgi:hypothetical protein